MHNHQRQDSRTVTQGRHVAEVKGLVSGSVYEFRVRAINSAGASEVSKTTMGETPMFSSGALPSRGKNKSGRGNLTMRATSKSNKSGTVVANRLPVSTVKQRLEEEHPEPYTPEGKEDTFRGRRGRFKVNHVNQDDF